ncbi:ParB/RepB/Spo0J family partition protein [Streptomyces cellulosae]|uniref:ParB/RepB/Spo0J family partition protein n=1 Tax=Streptomyces cellulosae TaxID=1968 RepID=A0ABW6JJ40_STRCE
MPDPKIIDSLQQHQVPIDSIKPWPGNPNQGDIDDIASSLEEFGQWRPAVVQKSTGQICIGNSMWIAAKEKLGWTGIAAILVDIDDVAARKMLARDNRSRDKATYNDFLLADFLNELSDLTGGDLDGSGWEPTDLDDLLKSTGALAADTTSFLTTFTEPDTSEAAQALAPTTAPAANPFSHAPQQPAGGMPPHTPNTGTPAPQTGAEDPSEAAAPTTTDDGTPAAPGAAAAPNPVHTGPEPYTGPGAPASAGVGPQLPTASITNVGWAVTLEQRDTIRNAIKLSKETNSLDDAAAAITAICQTYLDTHTPADADA